MNERNAGFAIDTLAQIAENVWIFDDAPINASGLRLPIRMTIIRLTGGNLRAPSGPAAQVSTKRRARS